MAQDFRVIQGSDTLSASRGYLNDSLAALRTRHSGPSAPSSPTAYMIWLDTTTGLIKERNANNDAWIAVGTIGAGAGGGLPITGGTMAGPIAMNNFAITGLPPGQGNSPARQVEVDLKAPLAAPAFTGDARVNQDPVGDNSLIRRSWAEARYAKLAGTSTTGFITLVGNATDDLHAVPLQQLRDFTAFNLSTGHRHDGQDARQIRMDHLTAGGQPEARQAYSTSSGGVAWRPSSAPHVYNAPVTILDQVTGTVGWTTYDLGSVVTNAVQLSDKYRGVLLHLRFESHDDGGSRYIRLDVRRNFATAGFTWEYYVTGDSEPTQGASVMTMLAVAQMTTDEKFDYRYTRIGPTGSPIPRLSMSLIGFI